MAVQNEYDATQGPPETMWATAALQTMLSKTHDMPPPPPMQQDDLKCDSLWTTAALVLKGYEAVPIELKILLDRLFASYHDSIRLERRHRLACLGWSEEDYERGYKLRVSDKYCCIY